MAIKVLCLNCTLKPSPKHSNTEALITKVVGLYEAEGAECEVLRPVDFRILAGISSESEGPEDEWPELLTRIRACQILLIGSPIWMGERSSVVQQVIERLNGTYSEADPDTGQFPLYNKVAAVVITGNEDGAHTVAKTTLFNLSHLGCTVPPNCDSYWVGSSGGFSESYIEAGGERYLYTNKTARFLVHNTLFFARLLKDHPIPTNLKALTEAAKAVSD